MFPISAVKLVVNACLLLPGKLVVSKYGHAVGKSDHAQCICEVKSPECDGSKHIQLHVVVRRIHPAGIICRSCTLRTMVGSKFMNRRCAEPRFMCLSTLFAPLKWCGKRKMCLISGPLHYGICDRKIKHMRTCM